MQYKLHSIAIASLALALPMPAGSPASHGAVAAAKPPFQTATWIGSNYTPAYAANQIQMWQEFQPEVIEHELAAAVKYFSINTLRVYLHNIVDDTESLFELQREVREKKHLAFDKMMRLEHRQFTSHQYAQANYMCMYLHSTGRLPQWYAAYNDGFAADSSGVENGLIMMRTTDSTPCHG